MTELEKLQNKPRHERTPLESCIVDAAILEEAERDGEIELMEKAAVDLAEAVSLLQSVMVADASLIPLPKAFWHKIHAFLSRNNNGNE